MLSKMLLLLGVIPLTLGCAGSADDVCTLATRHLETCTGTVLPLPDTCDSAKANQILGTSCAALTAEGSRSTSSLWDWLFGGGGGDKGKGEVPGDEPGDEGPKNNKCYCDSQCSAYNDCCSSCPGGYHGSSNVISDYGYRCATVQGICPLTIPKFIGADCECDDGRMGTTVH